MIMKHNRLFYHGNEKGSTHRYFEGWYFKHCIGTDVFCIIPSIARDDKGAGGAFIQVITNKQSLCFPFPLESFCAQEESFHVLIDKNIFTEQGIHVDITTREHTLKADLHYGPFTPLHKTLYCPDIMGPFSYVPHMECNHGILSLSHRVTGHVLLNAQSHSFDDGTGYIEKDWGRSFPKSWTWFACHHFAKAQGACVMLSIAQIPFLGGNFQGLLAVCMINGKQIRIATYHGAHLLSNSIHNDISYIVLQQRGLKLTVTTRLQNGYPLTAPALGRMHRQIVEYPGCTCHVRLVHHNTVLLDSKGDCAGFEQAYSSLHEVPSQQCPGQMLTEALGCTKVRWRSSQ